MNRRPQGLFVSSHPTSVSTLKSFEPKIEPFGFFIATLSSDLEQLATLYQQIWPFTHEEVPGG